MKLLDILDKKLTEKLDATHHKADILEEGTAIYKHREWRGLSDTAYDFGQWCRLWGILLKWAVPKAPSMSRPSSAISGAMNAP